MNEAVLSLETASARELIAELGESLAQVLAAMMDQRPGVEWDLLSGPWSEIAPAGAPEILWWAQSLQILPQPALWLGAPQATWEEIGARTLKAAGLDTVETSDARHTWLEILGQAFSSLARAVGAKLGTEVTSSGGGESTPPADNRHWAKLRLEFETEMPVWLAVSPALLERLESQPESESVPAATPDAAEDERVAVRTVQTLGRTMDLLLDVELPISISFGRTHVPLKDVLKLTTGSIVELNRSVSEAVEVLVNHSLIARGEVVVVDGNYGVRIHEIVSPQDRLRSVR